MNTPFIINPSFQEDVERHIFGNFLIEGTRSPLILGIFGPAGEGKTFQLDLVCKELGIKQMIISPGELESENAGHPGQLLRKLYLQAGTIQGKEYCPSILVINDIDTVLGDWGSMTQYTVNRQIVYGQLMAFCDFPNEVSGTATKRVPIVVTGNNPKILYRPLLRAGRMRLMKWEPTLKEKVEIVAGIFPNADKSDLEYALENLPNEPISFWSDAQARFWEHNMIKWMQQKGKQNLLFDLANGNRFQLGQAKITFQELISIAKSLKESDIREASFIDKN